MKFRESLSTERDPQRVQNGLVEQALPDGPGAPPDLGFLFLSSYHRDDAETIFAGVRERTGVRHLLGCTAESVIGGGRELEGAPGAALWLAELPGVSIATFEVQCEQTPDGFCFPVGPKNIFQGAGEDSAVLLVGEPFTMPVDAFVRRFNEDYPGVPMVGGMASGGRAPGENLLYRDGKILRSGAVGVLLSGRFRLRPVVAQGCRPIGKRHVVTDCDRNAIRTLGGRPALKVIQEMLASLPPADRAAFQSAPQIGLVVDERKDVWGPGDYLIRNVLGVDPAKGVVFINDRVRRGQSVQFHVRDGPAASEDLSAHLERERALVNGRAPRGGIIFACNGRGRRLFATPDHDISALREAFGPIPISGFFAQGEVGPVGCRNHLHGFTTCVALFCDP